MIHSVLIGIERKRCHSTAFDEIRLTTVNIAREESYVYSVTFYAASHMRHMWSSSSDIIRLLSPKAYSLLLSKRRRHPQLVSARYYICLLWPASRATHFHRSQLVTQLLSMNADMLRRMMQGREPWFLSTQ